jgi:hypothetical protein
MASGESRFEALPTTTTALVGRNEEIELLMRRKQYIEPQRNPGRVTPFTID